MSDDENIRKEYFIQYRNGLWTQIRAKEDWVWKFISFFAGALVLVAGLLQNDASGGISYLLLLAIILIIIFISFWGLLIILDSNYWMQRNLIIIGNIEKELLSEDDYGKVIPKCYMHPSRFQYTNSFFIQIIFFSIILLFLLFGYLLIIIKNIGTNTENILAMSQVISITFCSLLAFSMYRNKELIDDFWKARDDAPGKMIPGINSINKLNGEIETYRNSIVVTIFHFFTFFGTFSFFFSTLITQTYCKVPSLVGVGLIIFFGLLCVIALIFGVIKVRVSIEKLLLCRKILKILQITFLSLCLLMNFSVLVRILINKFSIIFP